MSYDVIIIGSGPGGYVCAIKAAQLGLKVAVIEKRATFGGTCLNIGCIPSKALLHASEVYAHANHGMESLGVEIGKPKLNLEKMMAHKDATVKSNVEGVAFLFKKNKIDSFIGHGKVLGEGKVSVTGDDGKTQELEAKNIVIATGSDVAGIPGVKVDIDEKVIVSSTGAIALDKVPEHIVVVGGGVIGLEMGSVWGRLGAKVTVVEYLDKILGGMDGEVSKQFQRILAKQGMEFKLGAKVTGVEKSGKGAKVSFEPVKGGDTETIDADIVLIATGRKPYTEGLGLEDAGVVLDERGRVRTDESLPDQCAGRLRHRRRHRRSDAGAQGRGRRRGAGRDHGRPGGPRELRRDSGRGLHAAGSGFRRQDRGRAQDRRRQVQVRQVPVLGQWPGAGDGDAGRLRQGAGGCGNRPGAGRPHHRLRRRRHDP
jgi:dihydrolipoamide dehydrogenase